MKKVYFVLLVVLIFSVVFAGSPLEVWAEKESPMLHEIVLAGKLPPLEVRLLKNPKVVRVENEIGKFGGTLYRGTAFLRSEWIPTHMTMEPLMQVHWPFPGDGPIEPNIAERWEFDETGTEMTVYLREGMKWSDGHPFTADDILFYWYDVMFNEKSLVAPNPNLYIKKDVVPDLKKIDDYTIKFTFPEPFFFAETAFATLVEWAWPKHHMMQFHPKYNKSATWDEWNKNTFWLKGRGKVTIQAWMLDKYIPGQKFTMVRNPYYWKVDTEGNQLPYIDRFDVREVEDRQSVALGNVSGEFDADAMWVGVQHLSLFLEEKDKPGRDYEIGYGTVPAMAIYFNFDAKDETVRKIVRNVDFRRAVSLAINREEIDRVLYAELLEPSSGAFSKYSPYHDEKAYQAYAQYDPERSKKLLDKAGMVDRNGDGIRELPTGEDVKLIIDVSEHDLYTPSVEMIVEYLADVGVKLAMNVQHQNLIEEHRVEGNFDLHVWDMYGVDEPLAGLELWVPVAKGEPFFHKKAYDNPFDETYAQFSELLLKAKGIPFDERVAALKKANRIMTENVFVVSCGYYLRPYIVSNRLGNVPMRYARIVEFGSNQPALRYLQVYVKYPKKK